MKLTGSQVVAEILIEHGVDTVFGYPGGTVLNVFDALYEYRDQIHGILTAHEQGASHAADGYARATGKPGVVVATSGPGATNLVTGLATAMIDSVPVIAGLERLPASRLRRFAEDGRELFFFFFFTVFSISLLLYVPFPHAASGNSPSCGSRILFPVCIGPQQYMDLYRL